MLLDMKKRAEEEVKKELGMKNAQILASRRDRDSLAKTLAEFFVEEKIQRLKVLDLRSLRLSISYRGQLQKEIRDKDRDLSALSAQLADIRERLAKARKETRVLEILKEKRLSRWKKEYRKEEQEAIDDVSQKGYVRRLNAAAADA